MPKFRRTLIHNFVSMLCGDGSCERHSRVVRRVQVYLHGNEMLSQQQFDQRFMTHTDDRTHCVENGEFATIYADNFGTPLRIRSLRDPLNYLMMGHNMFVGHQVPLPCPVLS